MKKIVCVLIMLMFLAGCAPKGYWIKDNFDKDKLHDDIWNCTQNYKRVPEQTAKDRLHECLQVEKGYIWLTKEEVVDFAMNKKDQKDFTRNDILLLQRIKKYEPDFYQKLLTSHGWSDIDSIKMVN
jgi:uncharacterized protein YxeA